MMDRWGGSDGQSSRGARYRGRCRAVPLRAAAHVDGLVRGSRARLTPDRVGYMTHPNWVSRSAFAVPGDVWEPWIGGAEGAWHKPLSGIASRAGSSFGLMAGDSAHSSPVARRFHRLPEVHHRVESGSIE